jgi:hypothetical protein
MVGISDSGSHCHSYSKDSTGAGRLFLLRFVGKGARIYTCPKQARRSGVKARKGALGDRCDVVKGLLECAPKLSLPSSFATISQAALPHFELKESGIWKSGSGSSSMFFCQVIDNPSYSVCTFRFLQSPESSIASCTRPPVILVLMRFCWPL